MNLRKVTLAGLTGFCFWVAGERIHDFYVENMPVGKQDSCFSIKYPGVKQRFQMKVIENHQEEKSSTVMFSLFNKAQEPWFDVLSYFQQRMLDPKKMECK